MVNRFQPHVLVLPEDDANRQLANGFLLDVQNVRMIQVLPVAGGWMRVLESFQSDHIRDMERYSDRFMVLLIDFDGRKERLGEAKAVIPEQLIDRVFVLGVLTEPENLDGGSFEQIGRAMAQECREGGDAIWGHELLQHNAGKIERLRGRFWPILFQTN